MKMYLSNNLLSLQIDKILSSNLINEEKISAVESLYDEIDLYTEDLGLKNFFHHWKYAFFLIEFLGKKLDQRSSDIDWTLINKHFDKIDDTLKKGYTNFEWCQDNSFLPFQLPYEESLKLSGEHNVFIASSFVLPNDYLDFKQKLKDLASKFRNQLKFIKEVKENLNKDIDNFKKQVETQDRRSIEILGVFSAVVLFASGSLQIFNTQNISFSQGIIFSFTFGIALLFFIGALRVLTREYSVKDLRKDSFGLWYMAILSLVLIVGTLVTFNLSGTHSSNISKEIKTTIFSKDNKDSVVTETFIYKDSVLVDTKKNITTKLKAIYKSGEEF